MAKAQFTKQMTISQFEELFPDDDACKAYLRDRRWPEGVRCPRCGSDRVYELTTRPFHWECSACRQGGAYRFSVLVGTIFENTNIGLRDWFRVIHMMMTSKKGISELCGNLGDGVIRLRPGQWCENAAWVGADPLT